MSDTTSPFSERHGFRTGEPPITVREDAPEPVRDGVLMLGYASGMGPDGVRSAVCEVLLRQPDRGNWSASNVEGEVSRLIDSAPWYSVYDIAEKLHARIGEQDPPTAWRRGSSDG